MADKKIDTSDRPSMDSVECATGCGQWIVIDHAYTGPAYCGSCMSERTGGGSGATTEAPAHWFSVNNPTPPDPTYPPGSEIAAIRVSDPDVTARCMRHPLDDPARVIHLMSLDPDDIVIAFAIHDHLWHRPTTGWLIGGPGGADGDICNPCGGGAKDKRPLTSVDESGHEYTGPRHDLCLRGNPRGGWGRNCPCTHDRPHMRGIKPGHLDTPGAVERTRALLDAHRPDPAVPPPPPVAYLFDPEEFDTDD